MIKRNNNTVFIIICSLLILYGTGILNAQDSIQYDPVGFIRLTSQNDLYQAYLKSDKHFTNGAHIQVGHKKFDIPVFRKILLGNFLDGNENYIVSVGQDMYTPEDFEKTTVDSTDRPYAGVLYATFSRTISSPAKLRIFRSSLILGVIGPVSGAARTQNFLHKILDNDIFQGWDHQIGNGLILDYALMYRKGMNRLPRFMDVSGSVNANFGTMLNYTSLSSRLILGKFNNPYYNLGLYSKKDPVYFPGNTRRNNFQIYTFFEGFGGAMLYNGTLSGSLVPFEKSPYIIPASEIPNWIYGGSYGVIFSIKGFLASYQHLLIKQQYASRTWHGWGELNLVFSF